MVGGGMRGKDDGSLSLGINSTNIFAALDSRRKKGSKKKGDKASDQGPTSSKGRDKSDQKDPEPPQQFWAPAPVTTKSWADVDDDDDYYATTAPPPSVWGSQQSAQGNDEVAKEEALSQAEESDGEEDGFDEVEDAEEEQDHETETNPPEPLVKKSLIPPVVSKEPERQLSKKELKKKELAELDAVLAELGIETKQKDDSNGNVEDTKSETPDGEVENIEGGPVLTESKSSKRRKAKKEKSFKEPKDEEGHEKDGESKVKDGEGEQPADGDSSRKEEEAVDGEQNNTAPIDKERIKKLASFRKKKSSKELDAAAKAAAIEAAARAAKLAAAKKKEKNHYNQQPVR